MNVFQVGNVDHATAEAAIAAVESVGSGTVIKFNVSPNREGCLPAMVYRSCAMWRYADNVWHAHAIFDGTGAAYAVERPH